MPRVSIGTALLVASALAACQPRLEQTWQLTDFRVLGVKVDPPEPARGADVMATLSSADVRDRAVSMLWLTCAVSLDATALGGGGGGGDGGASNPLAGCSIVTVPGPFPLPAMGTSVMIHIPETGGARDSSNREVLTLFAFACAGGTIGAPADGGTQPTCTGTDARGWSFTRTIRIHDPMSQDAPNSNPHIREVRFGMSGSATPITNDAPPTIPLCTDQTSESRCPTYVFEVGYEDGSREMFHAMDPNDGGIVERQERLTTGYVITAGELGGAFRADTAENPMATMQVSYRAPATAGDVHVVIYSADGRGGYDSTDRIVRVQ